MRKSDYTALVVDSLDMETLDNDELGFVMFEVDLGAARHISGPDRGKPMFPELGGQYTPMWDVRLADPDEEGVSDHQKTKAERARRVEIMRQRVADGLPAIPPEWEVDEPLPMAG